MSRAWSGGSTRRWRKLRAAVLERDAHRCQVPKGAAVCGAPATHVDHIIALVDGGEKWDPANLRAACARCNTSRGTRARAAGPRIPATVVIGPPGGGKSTHTRHHAQHGDIVIDLDAIANALTPPPIATRFDEVHHDYPQWVRHVAIGARAAAIRRAADLPAHTDARMWLVHAVPSLPQVREYLQRGWSVVVCDPGPQAARTRAACSDRAARHQRAIDEWYVRRDAILAALDHEHTAAAAAWDW